MHTILHFIKSCVFGITQISQPRKEASVMCNKASDGSSAGAWPVQTSKKEVTIFSSGATGIILMPWLHIDYHSHPL